MLFLRSPPVAITPRASPWFAWLATFALFWTLRRPISRSVLSLPLFRALKKKYYDARRSYSGAYVSMGSNFSNTIRILHPTRVPKYKHNVHKKYNSSGIKARVKRLCSGDGPVVTSSSSSFLDSHQINYRVTRSGRIYGKYANKQREMGSPIAVHPVRPQPTFYRRKYGKFIKTSAELEEGRRLNGHVGDKDQIGYAAKFPLKPSSIS